MVSRKKTGRQRKDLGRNALVRRHEHVAVADSPENRIDPAFATILAELVLTLSFPKIDGERKKLRQPLACLNRRRLTTREARMFHTFPKLVLYRNLSKIAHHVPDRPVGMIIVVMEMAQVGTTKRPCDRFLSMSDGSVTISVDE
jgi:hypothetical protein